MNRHHERVGGGGRGALRCYLVPTLILAIAIGQQLFFSVGFIIQAIVPSFEITGGYSIYLVMLAVLALLLFFKRLVVDDCRLYGSAWVILLIACLIAVSCLIHRDVYQSTWDFLLYFMLICIPALIVGITLDSKEGDAILASVVKLIDPMMIVVTIGVAAYEAVNYSNGFTNRALANVTYQQVSYMGALAFGMNCAMLQANCTNRFRVFQGRTFRVIQVVLLVVQCLCVVLSGGRGGFLLLCIYCLMLVFSGAKRIGRNIVKLTTLPFIILFTWVLLQNSFDFSGVVDTRGFERIFTYRDNRSEVFGSAIDIISNHLVVGCGVGGYFSELSVYPHNIVLEVLLNWGILGFLVACTIAIFAIASLTRLFKARSGLIPLAYIGMSPVVFLALSSSFMANATLWFFIGAAFSPLSLELRKQPSERPSHSRGNGGRIFSCVTPSSPASKEADSV